MTPDQNTGSVCHAPEGCPFAGMKGNPSVTLQLVAARLDELKCGQEELIKAIVGSGEHIGLKGRLAILEEHRVTTQKWMDQQEEKSRWLIRTTVGAVISSLGSLLTILWERLRGS